MAIGVFEKKVSHEASPVKQSIHTFLTEETHNSQETSYSQSCIYSIPSNLYCTLVVRKQFNWLGGCAAVGLCSFPACSYYLCQFSTSSKECSFSRKKNAIERILKTHSGHIYVFSYALLSSVVFCKPERDEPVRILKPCSYVRSSGRIRVLNQDLH